MLFSWKKIEVPSPGKLDTLDAMETWMVYWKRRYGPYHSDVEQVAQAFLNKDDADKFAKSLQNAYELLQDTYSKQFITIKKVN